MMLSDVPWESLMVGDVVISVIGNPCKITELIPIELAKQREDNEIVIEWNNGRVSLVWHFERSKITYDTLSTLIARNTNHS